MDLGVWETVCAVQALALAAIALRSLMGRREVRTVQPDDFKDGKARTFIPLCVVSDGTTGGTYLADAATRRPVEFSGVRASQIQHRFRADGSKSAAVVVIEGLKRYEVKP